MTSIHTPGARRWRGGLFAALLAPALLAPAALAAQQGGTTGTAPAAAPRKGFELFALIDFAATGVRPSSATYRIFVTNSGPMDAQSSSVGTLAGARIGDTPQFPEVTLFAAVAPGDRARALADHPSLNNVVGNGAALSFNFHKTASTQVTDWHAADGSLGFTHSGVRSNPSGCLNHSPSLPAGVPLMPGSDCEATWGLNGWQGSRPIPLQSYLQIFRANPNGFQFNFFDVPRTLQDTNTFLGDRFQTYGIAVDYSRQRTGRFGNVLPQGTGNPSQQGYPIGLEWKFDAFTMASLPGVVFWQATITNRTDSIYGGAGIDYDSLYVGVIARHGRRLRAHAGFDSQRGTAYFNEIGNDDATQPGGCDNARPVPGPFASDAFFGDCREPVRFGSGASAITFLKSPIGDLRYKLFTDSSSQFLAAGSPFRDDTITFNIGRMCGDECIADRPAVSAGAGFGIIASREELALNGDQPQNLSKLAYWMLFHPANDAAEQTSLRWDPANPRGGGGFNFTTVPTTTRAPDPWSYETRPGNAPAGADTLWFDTCNPTLNGPTDTIVVPQTRSVTGRCTGRWVDTLPDRTLNFTRNATWLGAGPFRLAAGQKTGMILAISIAPDSITLERNVDQATLLYKTFFVAPTAPPAPRITSVRAVGGTIRQTGVRLYFDPQTAGYVDPFVLKLAADFRAAGSTAATPLAKLNRLNPRLYRANVPNDTGLTIADTLTILASRQIARYNIYKSCNPGSGQYTRSSSPNLCTQDVVTDSLGATIGPAVYATINDTTYVYGDGNVLSGMTYQYVIVPVTRGVRLTLTTDAPATGLPRVNKDTVLVASRADLPSLLTAPNVATVYVPASVQSGGTPSRIVYREEKGGPQTFVGDTVAYNGPFVTIADSIPEQLEYRLVFGDSLRVREFQTNAIIDSTVVVVYRSATVGFTFGSQTTDAFSRYAIPTRRFLDSLVFTRREPVSIARSFQGPVGAPTAPSSNPPATYYRNDSTIVPISASRREVRWTYKFSGGAIVTSGQILSTTTPVPATITDVLPQGVLLERRNGVDVPVIVGNDFRSGTFGLSARVLGSPDYKDAVIDVPNRPFVRAFTTTNYGGAQVTDRYFTDRFGGRFAAAGVQSAIPTVFFQSTISRFIGTTSGEFHFKFADNDFGPLAPFTLDNGPNAMQSQLDLSLAQRARPQQTVATAAVRDAINASLGPVITATDSLLVVNLPFDIVDNSRDRETGGREVIAAIRASDKFYSPETLPPNGVGANANRWFRVGIAPDTVRVTVPQDQWVPGEPLILLERIEVADTANGVVRRDGQGNPVYRDSLVVIASRATIGCATTFPSFCNPLVGRGGTGYTPTQQGYTLVVRTGVPLTPEREITFAVTPTVSGQRVTSVARAQMDSVMVVPNPYLLYSSYEQSTANEHRVMFTHLPPQGHIRIYTATGQFVQQIKWTPADLNGNGDLYFNLLTREGTLMASGLYLFTVESTGPGGVGRRKKVGRFIIIR